MPLNSSCLSASEANWLTSALALEMLLFCHQLAEVAVLLAEVSAQMAADATAGQWTRKEGVSLWTE